MVVSIITSFIPMRTEISRMRCIPAWCWLGAAVILSGCSSQSRVGEGTSGPRSIQLTRVVRIPITNELGKITFSPADAAKLTLFLGGQDELPEGPDGFDVAADGSFLITDPLRKRITVFDRNGRYLTEWQVGFAADSLTILSDSQVQVRDAKTGDVHLFDLQGKPAGGNPSTTEPAEARLTGQDSGIVNWRPVSGMPGGPMEVKFQKAGLRLLSVQGIVLEPPGDAYIAVESTAGGDSVDLNKVVRRYASNGALVSETTNLPLDYVVRPTDEIRVRKGVIYQLMTTKSELQINIWDTNS